MLISSYSQGEVLTSALRNEPSHDKTSPSVFLLTICKFNLGLDPTQWKKIAPDQRALWLGPSEIKNFQSTLVFVSISLSYYFICLQVQPTYEATPWPTSCSWLFWELPLPSSSSFFKPWIKLRGQAGFGNSAAWTKRVDIHESLKIPLNINFPQLAWLWVQGSELKICHGHGTRPGSAIPFLLAFNLEKCHLCLSPSGPLQTIL